MLVVLIQPDNNLVRICGIKLCKKGVQPFADVFRFFSRTVNNIVAHNSAPYLR